MKLHELKWILHSNVHFNRADVRKGDASYRVWRIHDGTYELWEQRAIFNKCLGTLDVLEFACWLVDCEPLQPAHT
jgi:hypothetical protein